MFNLILTTLSIALTVALTLIAISYGGPYLAASLKTTQASDLVEASYSLKKAYTEAKSVSDPDVPSPTTSGSNLIVLKLIEKNYLKACPEGWHVKNASSGEFSGIPEGTPLIYHPVTDPQICSGINKLTSSSSTGVSSISCVSVGTNSFVVVPLE